MEAVADSSQGGDRPAMEFSGTFELEDAEVDEVWLALSDPAMIQHALRGCKFVVQVDDDDPDFDALRDEHLGEQPALTADPDVIERRAFREGETYAALVEADVGNVNPSFETVVTIDEREQPRMAASGEGSAGNSSFEMASGMELRETDDGVAVDWSAEADVFGRLAQMGQRMIDPVANRMAKRFFRNLQDQLESLETGTGDADETVEAAEAGEAGEEVGSDEAVEADAAVEVNERGGTDVADEAGERGESAVTDETGETDETGAAGEAGEAGEIDAATTTAGGDHDDDTPTESDDDHERRREGSDEADDLRTADADPDEETGGEGGFLARLKRLVGLG